MRAAGLAALAVAGDLALTAAQVLPLALPMLVGVLWLNNVLFYWAGAAALLLLAWVMRPTLRFDGRDLPPGEAPALHAELAKLKQVLGVAGSMQVQLDGSFNASAMEARGLFGLVGSRRVLTLGVPLLAALGREQVLAVIAHELGHFSRRHGRFGHWLYRAREGWIEYAGQVRDSDNAIDQAAAWFAKRFVPYFSKRSFAYSRQCEYEADADAAAAVGAASFAQALSWVAVAAAFQDQRFQAELDADSAREAVPPVDYHERFARGARSAPEPEMRTWLSIALAQPSIERDTHPGLGERLKALDQEAQLAVPAESAGESLLGERWPAVLAEFNERWVREAGGAWRMRHLRSRHLTPPRTTAELREVHEADAGDARTCFDYAVALLAEGDARGLEMLEGLARERPEFRASAFAAGAQFLDHVRDELRAAAWRSWLDTFSRHWEAGIFKCLQKAESGAGHASSLPEGVRRYVAAVVHAESCVGSAYLIESEAEALYSTERPPVKVVTQTLAIALDPAKLERHDEGEGRIIQRLRVAFEELVPADHAVLVRKHFTTEDLPAGFLAHRIEAP